MGQFADEIGGPAVEVVPVRAEEGIAVQIQQIAGGVGRVTVVRRDVLFLVQESQRQHGAVGQVELQGAIEVLRGVGVVVHLAIGVGLGQHGTAAYVAGRCQCTREVGFQVAGVEAAIAAGDAALEVTGRALEHHVDDAAHLAGAVEQPRWPTHDLDPVERRQHGHGAVDTGHGRGQAIDIELVVFVAAGVDRGAAAVVGQGAQAGGVLGQVVQVHELPVLDVIVGVDRDRLGNVAQRGGRLGAHGRRFHRIAAAFFRGWHVVQPVALDGDALQLDRLVLRRDALGQGTQREGRQQADEQPVPGTMGKEGAGGSVHAAAPVAGGGAGWRLSPLSQ